MATKRNASDKPTEPPALRRGVNETRDLLDEQLRGGRTILGTSINSAEQLDDAYGDFEGWTKYTADLIRTLFTTTELRDEFAEGTRISAIFDPTFAQEVEEFRQSVRTRIRRLSSIIERIALFEEPATGTTVSRPGTVKVSSRVFVVHGHQSGPREAVARLISQLRLEPVLLREQPNAGRTVIEKFEDHADVAFAVIVMTPEDVGALSSEMTVLRPRARQNVVLELGFFIGLLGRSKVVAIVVDDVEIPSDIDGVLYIRYDERDAWKLALAKEMRTAGLSVDLNDIT